jgi:hypothetical protein
MSGINWNYPIRSYTGLQKPAVSPVKNSPKSLSFQGDTVNLTESKKKINNKTNRFTFTDEFLPNFIKISRESSITLKDKGDKLGFKYKDTKNHTIAEEKSRVFKTALYTAIKEAQRMNIDKISIKPTDPLQFELIKSFNIDIPANKKRITIKEENFEPLLEKIENDLKENYDEFDEIEKTKKGFRESKIIPLKNLESDFKTITVKKDNGRLVEATLSMEDGKPFIKGSEDNFVNDIKIFGIGNVNEDKKEIKPGDTVRIGNELYLFDKNQEDHLNLWFLTKDNNNVIERLFPSGVKRLIFKQGQIADCYKLASVESCSLNPRTMKSFSKMVDTENSRPDKDSENFRITFPGYPKESFDVKVSSLKNNIVKGDLGVQVFEDAFYQLRKRLNWYNTQVKSNPQTKKDWLNFGYSDESSCILTEGKPSKFNALVKRKYYKSFKDAAIKDPNILKNLESKLKELNENKGKFIITACTGRWKYESAKNTYLDNIIYPRHEYSIADINPEKRAIDIINPHDTSKIHTITYDEFFKYFSRLSFVELDEE